MSADPPAGGMQTVLGATVRQLAVEPAIGLLTGVVSQNGADVAVTLRHEVAPMHLVMAALAMTREAEDAIGRTPGDNRKPLAALAVARHALRQAMGDHA